MTDDRTSARSRFAALVRTTPPIDLARAALEIARIGHPDLEAAPWLAQLDTLADSVRARLDAADSAEARAFLLARYLFDECGFRGNEDQYYDPRNSFLNDVLSRRTGIPITLSVVFMEVGRRVGVAVEGVGFPGHFLVRVPVDEGILVLDPFFGGRPLSESELLDRLEAFGTTPPRPEHVPAELLRAIDPRDILARMLRNLLQVYESREQPMEALHTIDLSLVLDPDDPDAFATRARLYEALDCLPAAAADYRRALTLRPIGPGSEQVRRRLARLLPTVPSVH